MECMGYMPVSFLNPMRYALLICTIDITSIKPSVRCICCSFSLIATNISMANEMHYGQRRCEVNNRTAVDIVIRLNSSSVTRNGSLNDDHREEFCNTNTNLWAVFLVHYCALDIVRQDCNCRFQKYNGLPVNLWNVALFWTLFECWYSSIMCIRWCVLFNYGVTVSMLNHSAFSFSLPISHNFPTNFVGLRYFSK